MAQVDITLGAAIGYPQIVSDGNIFNSGQLSIGARLCAAYRPEDRTFFPSANLVTGNLRLPLLHTGNNVAAVKGRYSDLQLAGNMPCVVFGCSAIIYGGPGVSYLHVKGIAPSGNRTVVAVIDSASDVTRFFPLVMAGFEMTPVRNEENAFQFIFGVTIQYTLLYQGSNIYYVSVTEQGNQSYDFRSALMGNLFHPQVYIAVRYRSRRM